MSRIGGGGAKEVSFNGRPICPKNRLLANIAFSFAKCIINDDNISYNC